MTSGKHLGKGSKLPVLPNDGKLRLYSMRFCPFAQRIHLILDAKEIPYHAIYINLTEKPEWLTEKSPLGKVPALELTNENNSPIIYESLIIADYLDEKYPEKMLHNKDPLIKAQDKILIELFNNVINPMYRLLLSKTGIAGAPGALTDIVAGLDRYEAELNKRDSSFFGGAKPGMLDYMIWPWCERADMLRILVGDKYEMDKERFPKLLNWRAAMIADPAVKQSFISPENHAKYIEGRRTGTPDYDMLVNPAKKLRTS